MLGSCCNSEQEPNWHDIKTVTVTVVKYGTAWNVCACLFSSCSSLNHCSDGVVFRESAVRLLGAMSLSTLSASLFFVIVIARNTSDNGPGIAVFLDVCGQDWYLQVPC